MNEGANRSTAEEIGNSANKLAAAAKDAVDAGKAIASAAAGNPVRAIAYAVKHKDKLFKLILAVIAVCALCVIGITQTLPTTIFSWADGISDFSAENETVQTLSTYNSLKKAAQDALDKAHKSLLSQISTASTSTTQIAVNDNYKSVGDDFICLAICAYSINEGNDDKTSVSGFQTIMDDNASKLLSFTSSSSTSNGKTIITYTITNNTLALKTAFGLTSTQYNEALTMAENLMTLIEEINGNSLDLSDLPTGSTDNGSGVSNNLLLFLASWEDYSAVPYTGIDSQNETIGYGHVIKAGKAIRT